RPWGPPRWRLARRTGCWQRNVLAAANRDTIRLLSLAGWDVIVPRGQGGCGALDLHAGRVDAFRERAGALTAAFPEDVDWIGTNAAGCGAALREADHWLAGAATVRLVARVRDVTELLVEGDLPLQPLP